MHQHGRRHRSPEEYEGRRQVYYESKDKVASWNSQDGASHECVSLHCCACCRHSMTAGVAELAARCALRCPALCWRVAQHVGLCWE